ncbi:hypothetical protein D3C85_1221550 [compost metagenome]
MPAVEIDVNTNIQFLNCRINLGDNGVGMYVGRAANLNVEETLFFGEGEPLIFDGGGNLVFERNEWLSPSRQASTPLVFTAPDYTPELMRWLVGGIVGRHFSG